MKRIKFDNVLYLFSLLYVIIPIILFVFGWLKIYYAICISLFFLLFLIGCYKKLILNNDFIFFKKDNLVFLIVAFVLLFLWVYFSGIGGYAFQHIDFRARNPMYKDLCEVNWPIFYDLSKQPSSVRQVLGSDKVALSYYFTWWLIPASIVKLFHFKTNIANLVLYIYSSIGIFLSMFLICKYLKNCKIKYILIFIFFGGLDIIAYLIFNKELPVWYHFMEIDGAFGRWLEYHSNTNQLYTVFNQAIPTWIILGLIINLKDDKYCVAICSLIFAYSPWAMILALPIALYRIIINNIKVLLTNICQFISNIISFSNVFIPFIMLIIFGSFYMSNSKGTMEYGLTLSHFDNITLFICKYLLFIVLKFLLFYIIIKKQLSKNVYFYISLVELIVIPLFYIRDKNLIMRGSIPALYLLMIMIMQFYSLTSSDKKYILNKKVLSVLLIISSVAALSQFSFSVYRKMTSKNYVNISLISFTHLDRCQDYYKELIANNFFAYDYKNKFFFKYLAK